MGSKFFKTILGVLVLTSMTVGCADKAGSRLTVGQEVGTPDAKKDLSKIPKVELGPKETSEDDSSANADDASKQSATHYCIGTIVGPEGEHKVEKRITWDKKSKLTVNLGSAKSEMGPYSVSLIPASESESKKDLVQISSIMLDESKNEKVSVELPQSVNIIHGDKRVKDRQVNLACGEITPNNVNKLPVGADAATVICKGELKSGEADATPLEARVEWNGQDQSVTYMTHKVLDGDTTTITTTDIKIVVNKNKTNLEPRLMIIRSVDSGLNYAFGVQGGQKISAESISALDKETFKVSCELVGR